MKILFITRNFPPQKGGLERVAHSLYSCLLANKVDTVLLKWSGSRRFLVFILPYLLLRAIMALLFCQVDTVYLFDGLLSILIPFLKIFRKPIVITIHGLDITFNNRIYQWLIPQCVALADKIICISYATYQECLKRGIPKNKICIIRHGIKDGFYLKEQKKELKHKLSDKLGFKLTDTKILLSVCRLVERKGIVWFLDAVLPCLIEKERDFVYIIAGDGPLRKRIEEIVHQRNLKDWVMLLGKVDDELLRILYNASDIFLMPNIPVKGDIEGLGIVALEAASCRTPVIASDLEGIKDAVAQGKNGFLVAPGDALGFTSRIVNLMASDEEREAIGNTAREFVLENFLWEDIIKKYIKIFTELQRPLKTSH